VPDCGNSEFFINLQTNAHLDSAYGGYCVFAEVAAGDSASDATMNRIAEEVKTKGSVKINKMVLVG
jgi:cyclophilin family peptidyl-prolyl cis-trans isomerase